MAKKKAKGEVEIEGFNLDIGTGGQDGSNCVTVEAFLKYVELTGAQFERLDNKVMVLEELLKDTLDELTVLKKARLN